jgi:mono/diheme cytochrome c family protein
MRRILCATVLVALVLSIATPMFAASDLASNDVYKSKCAMCHGPNGEGKAAMKTVPLADAAGMSDADLKTIITKGKAPRMPSFQSKLTDEQINQLVTAIKGLKK